MSDQLVRRFEHIDTDLIAWKSEQSCSIYDSCNLLDKHNSSCAIVSLSGLVLEVLPTRKDLSPEERQAMLSILQAYTDIEDAIDSAEATLSKLKRSGPARVKVMLESSYFGIPSVDYPIGDSIEEWQRDLEEYEDGKDG